MAVSFFIESVDVTFLSSPVWHVFHTALPLSWRMFLYTFEPEMSYGFCLECCPHLLGEVWDIIPGNLPPYLGHYL